MAIARKPFKLTYHDYALLPEDKRVELMDGDFLMSPAPGTRHQKVSANIFLALARWAKDEDLGLIRKPYIDGSPDLVAE